MSEVKPLTIPPVFKQHINEFDNAGQLLTQLQTEFISRLSTKKQLSEADKVICLIMNRVCKTCSAISFLLSFRFTESSQALLRHLVETVIVANWLTIRDTPLRLEQFQDKETVLAYKRLETLKRYLEKQYSKKKTRMNKSRLKEVTSEVVKQNPIAIAIVSKYQTKIEKVSFFNCKICPSVNQMVEDSKFKLPHITQFWISGQYIHFSISSLESNFKYEGEILDFGTQPNWKLLPNITTSTTFFMLEFARIFNAYFKTKMGRIIVKQRAKFNQFVNLQNKKSK
ncbi:MAG TPA: DUF5677 domain-containing protein [candidate division Zixibacteria bacterium]|nr:DUF5677 domain-containing protein [candidate division Zixibacteria bacterium]